MKKFLPLFLSAITLILSARMYAQGGTLPLNGSITGQIKSATPDLWTVTTTTDEFLQLKLTGVNPSDLLVTLFDETGIAIIAGPSESFNGSTVTLNADGLALICMVASSGRPMAKRQIPTASATTFAAACTC